MTGSKFFGFGAIVAVLACLSNLMAVSLQWWTYKQLEYFGTLWYKNKGLWDWCLRTNPVYDKEEVNCGVISEPEGYESTASTCMTLSLMAMVAGFVMCCLNKCVMKGLPMLGIIGACLLIVAGILSWIGVLSFADNYPKTAGNEPTDLHAGWCLGLCATVLSFGASALLVADRLAGKNQVYVSDDKPTPPTPVQG